MVAALDASPAAGDEIVGDCGRLWEVVGDASPAAGAALVALLGDHGWKLGELGGWGKHSLATHDLGVLPIELWLPHSPQAVQAMQTLDTGTQCISSCIPLIT